MGVKPENDGTMTNRRPAARLWEKSEFWLEREPLLRGYLESGMNLRQAAAAIGASYPATKSKAWRLVRLGIMPQKSSAEAASASEWVLAGYGSENDSGLQSEPGSKRRRKKPVDPTPHALILEHTEPIAVDPPVEAPKRGRGLAKGYRGFPSKAAYQAHYGDVANYRDELSAMERYAREADAEHNAADAACEKRTASRLAASEKRALKRSLQRSTQLAAAGEESSEGETDAGQIPSKPIPAAELKREWNFPAAGGCMFPHGDVGQPGFGFCAEPVAATGVPYCPHHITRVYHRKRAGEEVNDG